MGREAHLDDRERSGCPPEGPVVVRSCSQRAWRGHEVLKKGWKGCEALLEGR